jgi:hypothetical protein
METDGNRLRRMGKGTWYCRCGELANAEHSNQRCDRCRSGGDCGLDCSLSKLSCYKCGALLEV